MRRVVEVRDLGAHEALKVAQRLARDVLNGWSPRSCRCALGTETYEVVHRARERDSTDPRMMLRPSGVVRACGDTCAVLKFEAECEQRARLEYAPRYLFGDPALVRRSERV